MQTAKLSEMTKGWFIGNFTPTLHATEAVEVAVKEYPAGFAEPRHYHRVATEYTVIISGEAEVNGRRLGAGDIFVISPGERTAFRTLTPVITTVVKLPGASNDKYTD